MNDETAQNEVARDSLALGWRAGVAGVGLYGLYIGGGTAFLLACIGMAIFGSISFIYYLIGTAILLRGEPLAEPEEVASEPSRQIPVHNGSAERVLNLIRETN